MKKMFSQLRRSIDPYFQNVMQKNYTNLILTPHIAWAAREARQRALDRIADNIEAFQKGKPINVVKPRAL